MSLVSTPSASEWSRMKEERRTEWLRPLHEARVGVTGGNLAALVAGYFLQNESMDSVILVPAEQLGGRLTWQTGPVGIASPADRVLDDMGLDSASESPVFMDRHRLLHELAVRYLRAGGFVLTDVAELTEPASAEDTVDLSCEWSRELLNLEFEDLIGTLPMSQPASPTRTPESEADHMVVGTGRRQDGWVQAGDQALPERLRRSDRPSESSLILSGRKAAEIVLDLLG